MTVRARLLLMLLSMAIVLTAPALYSFRQLRTVRDIAFELRGRHTAAWAAAGELQTSLAEANRLQRSYIVVGDSVSRTQLYEALGEARASYGRLLEAGYAGSALSLGITLTELEQATERIDRFVQAGQGPEAAEFFREARELFGAAEQSLRLVVGAIDVRSSEASARAQTIAEEAATSTLLAFLAAIALSVVLGLGMTGQLTRPLRRLGDAMARVANGDFKAGDFSDGERADEIGDLARSFESMTQQLAELNRLKAEFVSRTSHNLKTPINVISGYSEMLEEGMYGELSAEQLPAFSAIREQVESLDRQVRQLVDLSRVEAGAFTVRLAPVYLDDLLVGVRRSFEALARQKNIQLQVSADSSAPPTILGDEDRLRNEVLGNLLANAFKFTPPGGDITLRAWSDDGRLELEVADTGTGIEPDDLTRIFDRYYQSANGARAAGSGLGLAIAREVVDRHGGRITAESEPGAGATFRVSLPIGLGVSGSRNGES
jgi:signal transduction histidine kinase